MKPNKKSFYIETSGGSLILFEAEEFQRSIMLTIGDIRYDIDPDVAFDIADALTMLANEVSFNAKEIKL